MRGKPWTNKEMELLHQHYPDLPMDELIRQIGRTKSAIHNRARHMGLRRPNSGQFTKGKRPSPKTEFKKGHNPWNAGNKGIRLNPKCEFKKGNTPANATYDGCVRVRNSRDQKTGKKRPYKWIRIEKRKWVLYQRYLWEQAHGTIAKGHVITFKDGNQMNCCLENLECISQTENAKRNCNREKISQALKLMMEEGEHPTSNLTDKAIAGYMGRNNKQLKEKILEHPELIQAKRQQLLLKRKLKDL